MPGWGIPNVSSCAGLFVFRLIVELSRHLRGLMATLGTHLFGCGCDESIMDGFPQERGLESNVDWTVGLRMVGFTKR